MHTPAQAFNGIFLYVNFLLICVVCKSQLVYMIAACSNGLLMEKAPGAIVIAYVVCWLPYHARRLMFCYIPDDDWSGFLYSFYHYFYMLTNTLFYVSSAVNPVLYNMVSSSFRQLFLETLGFSYKVNKQKIKSSVTMQSTHSLKKDLCAIDTQASK